MTGDRPRYGTVFLDIDGTMLTSRHQLTSTVRTRIRAAVALGVRVVLTSARMPAAVAPIRALLGLDTPAVCYNGAWVGTWASGGRLVNLGWDQRLPSPVSAQVEAVLRKAGLEIWRYLSDRWEADHPDSEAARAESRIVEIAPTAKAPGAVSSDDGWHKIVGVGSAEAVAAAHRALIAAAFPVTVARSKPIYLEVTAALAAKAAAALWLLGQWGLPAASAMAIGDGENDVGLLQAVGIGIAMGNAPAFVKQAAPYVTGSNDDDGVAMALDRWLFNP